MDVDHDILAEDEPVNADDLFDEDDAGPLLPPLSPLNEENAAGTEGGGEDAAGGGGEENKQPEPKRRKQINRLPNLNEKWLTDPKMEGLDKVNGYFKDIRFKKGKGSEAKNLQQILKRYEYWAQQCYPKLCFQDFVDKVEYLSGKKMIRHVLQEIRRKGTNDDDNINNNNSDDEEQPTSVSDPTTAANADMIGEDLPPPISEVLHSPKNNDTLTKKKAIDMTDDMREMIRRKREEAIEKRKRKLDESLLTSQENPAMPSSLIENDNIDNGNAGSSTSVDDGNADEDSEEPTGSCTRFEQTLENSKCEESDNSEKIS